MRSSRSNFQSTDSIIVEKKKKGKKKAKRERKIIIHYFLICYPTHNLRRIKEIFLFSQDVRLLCIPTSNPALTRKKILYEYFIFGARQRVRVRLGNGKLFALLVPPPHQSFILSFSSNISLAFSLHPFTHYSHISPSTSVARALRLPRIVRSRDRGWEELMAYGYPGTGSGQYSIKVHGPRTRRKSNRKSKSIRQNHQYRGLNSESRKIVESVEEINFTPKYEYTHMRI